MSAPTSPLPEAHHYIPKFYLKGFADNKELWVYENGKPARKSKPKLEAHRENYYTYDDKGYPDSSIEKMLSKSESLVAPLFRKLANPQFNMTSEQRGELFVFVALTFVRVPVYREYLDHVMAILMKRYNRDHAQNVQEFYAHCKKVESETGTSIGNYEEMRQFFLKGEYTITQRSAGYNMSVAFESCEKLMDILLREYNYDIWYAPGEKFFMTCDNPIVTIKHMSDDKALIGMGFGWKDTEVLFPLNKRACLILSRQGTEEREVATERRTDQINDMIMHCAQKYLYAPKGYKRISRLFDERGCKQKYGENALISRLLRA